LLSDVEDGRDISSLTGFSGLNVFGIGNTVITNYSVRGSINEIPTVSVSFAANNILYDTYTGNNLVPSLTLSGNQTGYRYSISSGVFNKANYVSNQNDRLAAIRPGDVKVIVSQPTLAGGVYNQTTGKIQNFQINIPFERKNLLGFGNNFSFDKKLMYPSVGTVSFNALFDKLLTGNYSEVFNLDETSEIKIQLLDCDGANQIVYTIENAKLTSENFNFDIGSSVNFDGSFEFPIDLTNGFKISGRSEIFDQSATNFLSAINNSNITIRSAINEFVEELKRNGVWYKCSGIYPFVGGTAQSHKYNLKNPIDSNAALRLTFAGAGTVHNSNGVNFIGSNDYADTYFVPSGNLTGLPVHISLLSLQDSSQSSIDVGSWTNISNRLLLYLDNSSNQAVFDAYDGVSGRVSVSSVDSEAFYVASRVTDQSGFLLLFNASTTPTSSAVTTTNVSGNLKPDVSVYLGNVNSGNSPFGSDGDRYVGFFSFGDGLTSGESVNLYTAVKNLQYNLGRNQSVFS
jgi:hypothetical protein